MRHEAREQSVYRPQDPLSHIKDCEHFPEALGKPGRALHMENSIGFRFWKGHFGDRIWTDGL